MKDLNNFWYVSFEESGISVDTPAGTLRAAVDLAREIVTRDPLAAVSVCNDVLSKYFDVKFNGKRIVLEEV